ncbi:T3SS effector HopA1 family protein [Streptomyces sp. NPDC127098]|uniref:T3SS effector HopA1 family protein n=1 Tax=Streptomyces sp. NPDC127098 TaxID=3347137 RepID=UPI0036512597
MTVAVPLAPRLAPLLDQVEIADDGLGAAVAGHSVEVADPGQLATALARLLYEHVHSARPQYPGPAPRTPRDLPTEQLLVAATPHLTTTVLAQPPATPDSDPLVLRLDGVNVAVPREHLAPQNPAAGGLVTARLPSVRPRLSPGFLLADGSRGQRVAGPVLRVYVNIQRVHAAPAVWGAVVTALENAHAIYRAKVSSAPDLFPRRDALVVYLPPESWDAVPTVATAVAGVPGVGTDTSPFSHQVAPGVAIAWEPDDQRPGRAGMSFGEHRSTALAEGLVAGARAARTSGVWGELSRERAVVQALTDAGVDAARPARNIGSPDIPELGTA